MEDPKHMNLRIIHVNTERGWRGGERQVFNLARQLQERGIAQIVAAKKGSELARRLSAHGIEVAEFAFRGEWDIFSAQALARSIESFGANVLHAHTAKAHSIALLARKKIKEENLVFVVSRRVDFPIHGNLLSKKKYFHPLVDGYLAISQNVRRRLIEDGIPKEKIGIAYSGIDLSIWERKSDPVGLRSEFRIHPEMLVLGNVAALEEHKDQATLLSALAILESEDPAFESAASDSEPLSAYRLLILGEGSLRSHLQKKARDSGILYPEGPVEFVGHRDDIYDFYRMFDVFVLSSKEEGLGTAVLDAMAAGLPVAATRAGGIPEMIVDGEGGLLSEPGDAKALARNLSRLLHDTELRKQFSAYNKKRVRDFSHEATCDSTLAFYARQLEQKGGASA